ncbi:response regulator [Desulfolutivibrio sulfoxidireducens]|uniref:response regulator n=1 Tax=Desulfolutivibrio sulfoxidireducens TaxID=2773299 RepID=UPI00159D434E|nr:response regulator [Desulfolutivibrio sulfoxidireducens]QLA18308.1 response regulator [Desulfolutivibrio sulfoxidireducens]
MKGNATEKGSILVVDDEPIITAQLEDMLGAMGYHVLESAGAGEEAVDFASRLHPDLVLMDIVMPGRMDGIAACDRIQREFNIPVVLLTAFGDDEHIARAKAAHPYGYILKPYQNCQIKASVEIALEKKRMERALEKTLAAFRAKAEDSELRLREAHHRIKNHLNVVAGLLGLQSEVTSDAACRDLLEMSRHRVLAVAHIHERLSGADRDRRLDCREYLCALVERMVRVLTYGRRRPRLVLEIENIVLDSWALAPLGLIANELLSNTVKHAFPGDREGEIRVSLRARDSRAELVVSDNGVGLPQAADAGSDSLGLELVRGLAAQLDGGLTLERGEPGTRATVFFPL